MNCNWMELLEFKNIFRVATEFRWDPWTRLSILAFVFWNVWFIHGHDGSMIMFRNETNDFFVDCSVTVINLVRKLFEWTMETFSCNNNKKQYEQTKDLGLFWHSIRKNWLVYALFSNYFLGMRTAERKLCERASGGALLIFFLAVLNTIDIESN